MGKIKINYHLIVVSACLVYTIGLTRCKRIVVQEKPLPNGYSGRFGTILSQNTQLRDFYSLLNLTKLLDTLNTGGPFTVFGFPDTALVGGYSPREQSNSTSWIDGGVISAIKHRMQYHIVSRSIQLKTLPFKRDQLFTTINGNDLYINKYKGGTDTLITVNGCVAENVDLPAGNGFLNFIYPMLSDVTFQTVKDALVADLDYSIFVYGINRVGWNSVFNAAAPYTVFAPTNAAFLQFKIDDGTIAAMPKDSLLYLLQSHIVPGGRKFLSNLVIESRGYDTANAHISSIPQPFTLQTLANTKISFVPNVDTTIYVFHAAGVNCYGNNSAYSQYFQFGYGPPGSQRYTFSTEPFGMAVGNGVIVKIDQVLSIK